MNLNVNNPSIIKFLGEVTSNILSSITVESYFSLSSDKKMGVLYAVFKLMKSAIPAQYKPSDMEMRSFVAILWKRNEEIENYEFAAVLNDILNNFDSINEVTKAPKKIRKETRKSQKND